jgi:cytidylate kinase
VKAYKSSLQEYNNNLKALEGGENPSGLQEAYERAVQQAEEKFGPSKETSTVQKEAGSTGVKPASKEVTEQLENSLLNTLFEGVGLGNASKEEQEKMREEIRGHIRETEGYQKMILSGDDNITAILNDPEKRHYVYTDIFNSAAEKMEQNVKPPINDELQRNNEKEMKQENIMLQIQ